MLGFSVFKRFCCFPCFWKLSVSKDTFARGESAGDILSASSCLILSFLLFLDTFSCGLEAGKVAKSLKYSVC